MKIFYLLSAALLLGSGTVMANSKIDARGRQLLDMYHSGTLSLKMAEGFLTEPLARGAEAMADVLVETNNEAVLDSLTGLGYNVEYITPDFSIVTMPVNGIEQLAMSPTVKALSFGHVAEPAMDEARGASYVNTVHTGLGIAFNNDRKHPFKGDGVVVGMFDTGFDPSHINFMNDDQTECRIKMYARYSGSSTSASVYTGDDIRGAMTDDADATHGTHVAGIMGGAYNGAGKYIVADGNTSTDKGKINLYGVAPHADLAICAGPLYNNSILAGIRRLINYANSQDKPLVVNLSLGNTTGPHDGSDEFSRALDQLGNEAIICVAAGNEGSDYIHAGKTFSATDKELKVLFTGNKINTGLIDIWSSTKDEIKVSVILANPTTGEIVAKMTSENGRTITCGKGGDEGHTIFFNSFDGSLAMTATDKNNRYNVSISCSQPVSAKNGTTTVVGLMIEGNAGVRVDAYGKSDGITFAQSVPNGFDRSDNDGSISGMACGFNTIIVGAYGTRAKWYDLNGRSYNTGGGAGPLANYSSWGTLVDGRSLPHITAPGTGICSSYSGPYVKAHSDESWSLCATMTEGDTSHYWGSMNGTSMATPYVTGTIALWLEANPFLHHGDVLDILQATANKDSYVTDAVAWGAGKIHASNGIKEVIKRSSGIEDITTTESAVLVSANGRTLEVVAPEAADVTVDLYTMAGVLANRVNAKGGVASIDAPAAGLYIVSVKAGATTHTEKVLVK